MVKFIFLNDNTAAMHKRDPLRSNSPGSQRLRWVRLAEGFENMGLFARRVGLGTTAYSQYENGFQISRDAVIKIANRVPGLTTDYLLRGREEGMSTELRQRIEAVREREEAEATGNPDRAPDGGEDVRAERA